MKNEHNIAVDLLKVIASIFIVNSHLGGVWPVSQLATGGLIGDCLFFMASGYCLYEIRHRFLKWYLRRIIRVYPAVWISICVGLVINLYRVDSVFDVFRVLIYPTPFHFVGSIMVCYVIYFFAVSFFKARGISLKWLVCVLSVGYFLVYIILYDKSYYHVDVVEENFIRFLFLGSMLIGALLKETDKLVFKLRSMQYCLKVAGILLFGSLYFATKMLFSHYDSISGFQFINQITILIFVSFLFVVILSTEQKIKQFSKPIIRLISGIGALTLEIYVFHHYFIGFIGNMAFPLNIVLIIICTLVVAFVVHTILDKLTEQLKRVGL